MVWSEMCCDIGALTTCPDFWKQSGGKIPWYCSTLESIRASTGVKQIPVRQSETSTFCGYGSLKRGLVVIVILVPYCPALFCTFCSPLLWLAGISYLLLLCIYRWLRLGVSVLLRRERWTSESLNKRKESVYLIVPGLAWRVRAAVWSARKSQVQPARARTEPLASLA